MKIIPIGRRFVNLDKVILIDEQRNIFLEGNQSFQMSQSELEEFVKMYNLMDTDEVKDLTKKAIQVLFTNPQYLTEEGLRQEIRRLVNQYDLKDFVVEHNKKNNKGKKTKDLTPDELVILYKAMVDQIKKNSPF